jgi:hypothetical protein
MTYAVLTAWLAKSAAARRARAASPSRLSAGDVSAAHHLIPSAGEFIFSAHHIYVIPFMFTVVAHLLYT